MTTNKTRKESDDGKKTQVKRRAEMKKIENQVDKLVTFSKRRSGVYKKASELVTLCGAQVGVLIFSPAERVFSYGSPSFEAVAQRFLHQGSVRNDRPSNTEDHPLVNAHRQIRTDELIQLHNQLADELEVEKERRKTLQKQLTARGKDMKEEDEDYEWWKVPMDTLDEQQLQKMHQTLVELSTQLGEKIDRRKIEMSFFPANRTMFQDSMNYPAMVNIHAPNNDSVPRIHSIFQNDI